MKACVCPNPDGCVDAIVCPKCDEIIACGYKE